MTKTHAPDTPAGTIAHHQRELEKADAKGQFAASQGSPNHGGLSSAKPIVLNGNGDATFEGDPHQEKAAPEKDEP